jgi:hypothetical protein
MALALKKGVPVIAVDSISGGAKVTQQVPTPFLHGFASATSYSAPGVSSQMQTTSNTMKSPAVAARPGKLKPRRRGMH